MRLQINAVTAPMGAYPGATALFSWRVGLFHPTWRAPISEIAAQDPALADLAESFPALLFALASGYGTPEARLATFEAMANGASLQAAADTLGLAWWTRKLPASAFRDPLPEFPLDADFSRRMANLVPEGVNTCALWLTAVAEAVPAGGRQYTLWVARHGVALMGTLNDTQRQAFHAWIWLSWHPGTVGHTLVRRPWANDLGIKRVLDEFGAFLARVALSDALGEGRLGGFVDDLSVHGLFFKPLRSVHDYVAAAAKLDNCLEQYADRLKRGTCAVAVILDGEDIVGCVEIGPHASECAMPTIVQLRTARNRRASAALWSAAYAWLAACDMRPLIPHAMSPGDVERRRIREALWGPYLAAIASAPGCCNFHDRARAALEGDPPTLDPPGLFRQHALRARPIIRPELFGHASLFERLANLAARHGRGLR